MEAAAAAGEPGAAAAAAALAGPEAAPQPRLALYSGHDTTIMPLLVTLGGDLSHWPPYVSNLVRPWRGRAPPCVHGAGRHLRAVTRWLGSPGTALPVRGEALWAGP
jgi:hypothetical protein